MFKELLLLGLFIGLSSSAIVRSSAIHRKVNDAVATKRGLTADLIAASKDSEDAHLDDQAKRDDVDFDNAMGFYDYISDIEKRGRCTHNFRTFCPILAKSGYCVSRRRSRKGRFARKYCAWACGRC